MRAILVSLLPAADTIHQDSGRRFRSTNTVQHSVNIGAHNIIKHMNAHGGDVHSHQHTGGSELSTNMSVCVCARTWVHREKDSCSARSSRLGFDE
eukprot:40653-Eustigmatos_ZCMA.PRE.1